MECSPLQGIPSKNNPARSSQIRRVANELFDSQELTPQSKSDSKDAQSGLIAGNILIVDDNQAVLRMLSSRMIKAGYEVDCIDDGRKLLEAFEIAHYDVVLLDVMMPAISGFDVLRHFRLSYSASELPIIMVTACSSDEEVIEALQSGANDYITKPINFPVALARVQTQVSRKRAETAMRNSEERYALAARGAKDGLWDWDLRTGVLYTSDRFKSILGYSEQEPLMTMKKWKTLVHPNDRERFKENINDHLEGRQPWFECEYRLAHQTGKYIWVSTRGTAVRDDQGNATRLAGSQTELSRPRLYDTLTTLPNRILFTQQVDWLLTSEKHRQRKFAVLFIDIERFKRINNSEGIQAGDALLVAIARRLEQCFNQNSISTMSTQDGTSYSPPMLARFGGDQFLLLLEGDSIASDVKGVENSLRANFANPFNVNGIEFVIRLNVGVVQRTSDFVTSEEMLQAAEFTSTLAKQDEHVLCKFFDRALYLKLKEQSDLERRLPKAIEQGEFVLHYQPILCAKTGKTKSVEALVRWEHPEKGLLSPDKFIPIAEERHWIMPLGDWILEEACSQLKEWHEKGFTELAVSVNVSPSQFRHRDWVDRVRQALYKSRLPATHLKLEITENVIIEHEEESIQKLQELSDLGVEILLDDFGTGYSSFAYLHRLCIDMLKVDKSFTDGIPAVTGKAAIMKGIISLSHSLDLKVVVEGVETQEQADFLKLQGSDFVQGYHFHRPLPPKQLLSFLREVG